MWNRDRPSGARLIYYYAIFPAQKKPNQPLSITFESLEVCSIFFGNKQKKKQLSESGRSIVQISNCSSLFRKQNTKKRESEPEISLKKLLESADLDPRLSLAPLVSATEERKAAYQKCSRRKRNFGQKTIQFDRFDGAFTNTSLVAEHLAGNAVRTLGERRAALICAA